MDKDVQQIEVDENEEVKETFVAKFTNSLKYNSFVKGITNLFNWFKIIWNDRQWDYYYFLVIIQKKLELMINYRLNSPHFVKYVGRDTDLRQMYIAKEAVDRLVKDDYLIIYDDWNEAKKRREEDYKILFNTIRDELPGWWD